jgi:ABC-type transport system involved in cytochrome bd biosynthesis fused ATPase/permease subunit
VAWVPQLPYLFNASVADNIRLGRPGAPPDRVTCAAQAADAHEFIQALPNGYETIIGERGIRLSGGQAQRIALARAFLSDAPLVVLDEATAHLDPEAEAEIEASIERLQTDRTMLVIAHRLHTVRRADLILVLDGGRIIEAGAHEALSKAPGGTYARLLAAHAELEGARERKDSQPIVHQTFAAPRGSATRAVMPETTAARADTAGPQGGYALKDRLQALGVATSAAPTTDSRDETHTTRHASRLTFDMLRFLLSFMVPFGPRILLSILLGFATVACGIGLMGASAWIIASAALGPSIAELQVAIVGVRFFGIARGFARYGERLASHDVTFRVLARLRVWFYAAIEPLAPAGLAQQRSGDLLSRVVGDINALENFYLRAVAPIAVATLTALLAAFLVGRATPRLAGMLLLFLVLGGVAAPLLARILGRQPGRRLAAARGELNVALVDGIQGMADLVAFGATRAQLDRVRVLSRELSKLQRRMTATAGLNNALLALCTALAALTILAGATPLVASGALNGVSLAVLIMIAMASFEAVAPLPAAAQYLESSLEAGWRLLALAEAPAEPVRHRRSSSAESVGAAPKKVMLSGSAGQLSIPQVASEASNVAGDSWLDVRRSAPCDVNPLRVTRFSAVSAVSFENVWFRYAVEEPWVLRDVSFTLAAGEHLTIVGPSGSGKTTLVNLLLRFWDAQEGCIRLSGCDLRDMDAEEVRRSFGVVTQNTYLFSGSIRDNLLLARADADQADLDAAVAGSQLVDFVRSLPNGYDTWVGEVGLRLSGGERQRLAIARALLKNAPMLILDEPVANLDPVTGRAVLDAVRRLMSGRSVLSITHSLAGAKDAGEVLVLREGTVVERGRHSDLMARGGFYRRMWLSERGSLAE